MDYFSGVGSGVVGDLGTGKTQLLQSLVRQITAHPEDNRGIPPKFLILDYKRDYCDPEKPEFIEKTNAKIINPLNIPLNLFDTRDSLMRHNLWLERAKFFTDILNKIFNANAPVQRVNIKNAVRSAFDDDRGQAPTIYDVFSEYKEIVGTRIDSSYSIMSDIVDSQYFEPDKSKILPFSEFFDRTVVVDLSQIPDVKSKNMIVVIFLSLYYEYMLKLKKTIFIGTDPQLRSIDSFLLVDEAENIMTYEFEVLDKLLLQGREFGIGVILSSQYLSHFKTSNKNYMEPLYTWFVHRVSGASLQQLEKMGLSNAGQTVLDRISSLKIHECFCKTLGHNGEFMEGIPFYKLD